MSITFDEDDRDKIEIIHPGNEGEEDIEESLQIHISVNQTARFLIHYAFCIERLIDNAPVTECADLDDIQSKHSQLFSLVRQAIIKNLPSDITPITDAEVGYITMIFL